MSDDDKPIEEPTPVASEAPEWARELMRKLDELPSKLTATVTDDDRNSIAERVHGLFEGSGAFEKPEAEPKSEPETEPETETEHPPKKESRLRGFASRFAGEE